MLLGTIMNQLRDETAAASALMQLGDLVLVAQVDAARAPHDESIGEYVSGAAQRFARLASDADWLALTTALERAAGSGSLAPAATCLATMVRWSIVQDGKEMASPGCTSSGCNCGGGGGSYHDGP